jgi:hypothetical protein
MFNDHAIHWRNKYTVNGHNVTHTPTHTGKQRGVVMSSGETWKEYRRFTLHVFRDFGVGKTLMEDRIVDEVHEMVDDINSLITASNNIDIIPAVEVCVANIICRLLWSFRYAPVWCMLCLYTHTHMLRAMNDSRI